MSAATLAEIAGVSRVAVYRYESEIHPLVPSDLVLLKVCDALGLDFDKMRARYPLISPDDRALIRANWASFRRWRNRVGGSR